MTIITASLLPSVNAEGENMASCFEQTVWGIFREAAAYSGSANMEEYTASLISYISKWTDDVTVSKTITKHTNQKPWMTAEVHMLLKAHSE